MTYPNPGAGITLAGTLTKPSSAHRHPAALLITGSGPHDRDETLFGHRPFLVIADHLTRQGLAVLRVDDRGVGESTGDYATAATDDFASDVRAGVDFLKTRPDVRTECIGLIGHSDGAIIAPMVAAESPDVAWIVMLAGTGVPGDELLLAQGDLIAAAMGVPEEVRAGQGRVNAAIYEVVKREQDDARATAEIERLLSQYGSANPDAAQVLAQARTQIPTMLGPWFRSFIRFDPAPTIQRVSVPVLAMNGGLDLQVPARQNLPAIVAALEAGVNPDYAAIKLPVLNHLFQSATTGSPAEYESIEETFAPLALKTMTEWLLHHL